MKKIDKDQAVAGVLAWMAGHKKTVGAIILGAFMLLVLAGRFHSYRQRSAAAAVSSIAAAQTENAGAGDALGNPILPGLTAPPSSLRPGTAEQTVTCPGQTTGANAVTALSATFTVPGSVKAGCTVTWAFFTQVLQTDAGFSTKLDPNTGAFLPLGEPVSIVAHGAPAAVVTVATDGGHTMKFQHRAGDDLANAQGPYLLAAGWHRFAVAVSIIGAGESPNDSQSPKPLVIEFDTGTAAPTPYWSAAAASNPHIAQQAAASTAAAGTLAVVVSAATIQPPEGVAAGWITRKAFSRDQFGSLALVSTVAEKSSTLTVTAPSRAGNAPAQRLQWSGWIKLDQPASVAMLRLAGGQGTVSASVDGMPLGRPVERWPQSAASQQTASVSLAPGWHQFAIIDDEAAGMWGDGSSIQVAIGDGSTDPQPPMPWAVPPTAPATSEIPRNACMHDTCVPSIAQHAAPGTASNPPASAASASPISRNNSAAKPVAPSTTGDTK